MPQHAWIRFRVGNEFLERIELDLGIGKQEPRRGREPRHGKELLGGVHRIVAIQDGVESDSAAVIKRVPIRLGAGHVFRGDGRAGTRLELQQDRLPETLLHHIGRQSRHRIHHGARRKADHEPDRLRRVRLPQRRDTRRQQGNPNQAISN